MEINLDCQILMRNQKIWATVLAIINWHFPLRLSVSSQVGYSSHLACFTQLLYQAGLCGHLRILSLFLRRCYKGLKSPDARKSLLLAAVGVAGNSSQLQSLLEYFPQVIEVTQLESAQEFFSFPRQDHQHILRWTPPSWKEQSFILTRIDMFSRDGLAFTTYSASASPTVQYPVWHSIILNHGMHFMVKEVQW